MPGQQSVGLMNRPTRLLAASRRDGLDVTRRQLATGINDPASS